MELNNMKEKIKQILFEEYDKMDRQVPWSGMYDDMIERITDVLQEEISKRS